MAVANILFSYTLKDAWLSPLHSFAISDSKKNNVACINDVNDTKKTITVDSEVIEKIKEVIQKNKAALKIEREYHGDTVVFDGAINHFFINNDGKIKVIDVYNMHFIKDKKIQPLRVMLKDIKDILCSEGIESLYFEI